METVVFTADVHECSGDYESRSLFPARMELMQADRRMAAYKSYCRTIHACFVTTLHDAHQYRPRIAVHLGDLTNGDQERGMAHPSVMPVAEQAVARHHAIAEDFFASWGNHDTGYGATIGGLSIESLLACKKLSPWYWKFEIGDFLFLGICSPLLRPYVGKGAEEVRRWRIDQEDFIADTLRENRRPWVLCAHDPNIRGIAPQIHPYLDKLERFIFADAHLPIGGAFARSRGWYAGGSAGYALRRGIMCPSVAPLWWRGGGYLVGMVKGGMLSIETFTVRYEKGLAERVRELPFSSFPKALYWMSAFHIRRRFLGAHGTRQDTR